MRYSNFYSKFKLILFVLIIISLNACSSKSSFNIVKDGSASAKIIISPNAPKSVRFAANELQKYIYKMSSVELTVTTDNDKDAINKIIIGNKGSKFINNNTAIVNDSLGNEGFIIRTDGNILELIGGGNWGTVYSVYSLLEKLGCRWFMPGPLGEVVPHNQTIRIEDINDVEVPSFKYRHIGNGAWSLANRSNNFINMHGLKGYYQGFSSQNYAYLVPSKKYFKKHPNYFALHNGKRTDKQLNLRNNKVVNIVADDVENYFKAHPGNKYPVISVTPNDNSDWSNSKADYLFGPTVSDQVMRFTNEVAEKVGKKYPNKLIDVLAYQDYVWAPKTIKKMKPNVAITFCRIDSDGVYSYPITSDNHYSKRIRRIINNWLPKADHFLFYDYYAHYSWFGPWPLERTISADYKYYRSLGPKVEGLVPEFHPHWGTQGINDYVMAKLSWNVKLNVDSLVNDYYTKFYQNAAGEIKAYFNTFDQKIKSLKVPFNGQKTLWLSVYTPEVIKKAKKHLNNAWKLAGSNSVLKKRIELLADGLHCVELKVKFQSDRKSGNIAAAYKHASNLINLIKSFPVNSVVETNLILNEAKKSLGYIKRDIAKFKNAGLNINLTDTTGNINMIKNWHIIGPFPNEHNQGWNTEYAPEKEINLNASYDGKNSKQVSWKIIKSNKNYIDLESIYPHEADAAAYALSYVNSPIPNKAFLAIGSDDGVKAWLNNKLVGKDHAFRTADAFQDMFPVVLKKGWNKILLKITQGAGGWGFYSAILNNNAYSVSNLKYSININN